MVFAPLYATLYQAPQTLGEGLGEHIYGMNPPKLLWFLTAFLHQSLIIMMMMIANLLKIKLLN